METNGVREDRQKLWEEYTGDKPNHLRHPWLDYDRYRYSNKLVQTFKDRHEDFGKLVVIDYGCGVGDYGFDFGRNGSKVIFYDNDTYINFVKFRYEQDPAKFDIDLLYLSDGAQEMLETTGATIAFNRIDLAIFGEVLEHLEDPLRVISAFVKHETKYIFTSSYPFRNDDPADDYWHHPGHEDHDKPRVQQKAIRELLFQHYERLQYNGEASLWIRKNAVA